MKNLLYILSLTIVLVSCSKEPKGLEGIRISEPPAAVAPANPLSIGVSIFPGLADNYTYAKICAIVTNTTGKPIPVTFTTDKGLFTNNSTSYSISASTDSVKAYLRHNLAEVVKISITASTTVWQGDMGFKPAPPEFLILEPATVTLSPFYSSNTKITAKLGRQYGSVTPGQSVFFSDLTPGNKTVGIFLNTVKSNEASEAAAMYWIQDTTYRGQVFIKASVSTPSGLITGSNVIVVTR